ncbi:hypothetical protein KP509_15G028900 [Ceratopteris richardii]|uniref:Uncharacterized protein n=1 Tax=Ceratopteris richardii TaxID=49495 RepID=A0A8T2T3R5_CERRI|nr:hypothetical protein KP509_15G028900 [Ceratopteris richardii]
MDKTRRDEQDAWERTEGVKRKIHRTFLSRRFYLRAAEIKLRRNRSAIAAATLRNRQLRSALNSLREKERCALGVNDLARVQKRVSALEKYHNQLLSMSKAQRKLMLERQTDAEMAKIDCDDVLDQNTPPLRKHRALAALAKKCRSDLQKAHAKDLKYQDDLKPMLDARTVFDAQVDTLARSVTEKHNEFDKLIFMYHDACRTREAARGQLQQLLKENFEIGVRYYQLFRQPARSSNKRVISEVEEAIANLTTKFRAKSMKDIYLALIEEQRKNIYMQYFKHELQEMIDILRRGSTSAKNYHERVIKLRRRVFKPMEERTKVFSVMNEDPMAKREEAIIPRSKKSASLGKEVGTKHKLFKMIRGTQRLIEKIQEGRLYNSENEHLKRILAQLEQKLIQILQGLETWMEGMKAEKAKQVYARLHRTSIMIRENYEKSHGARHKDDTSSIASTQDQD